MIPPFVSWLVNSVIAIAFILLGYYTFGNAMLFDRLFFLCLLFAGFFCRKDVNVLSVVFIIVAGRVLDEAGFQLLDNPDLLFKIMVYPLLGLAIYRFKDDELFYLAMAALLGCVCAEIYWLAIGYQPPNILWSLFGMLLSLAFRYALIFRLFVIEKFYPGRSRGILIDFIIRLVAGAHIIISVLMITEYLLRHVGGTDVMYMYNSYPYVSHALALITLWALFHQAYQQLVQSRLQA